MHEVRGILLNPARWLFSPLVFSLHLEKAEGEAGGLLLQFAPYHTFAGSVPKSPRVLFPIISFSLSQSKLLTLGLCLVVLGMFSCPLRIIYTPAWCGMPRQLFFLGIQSKNSPKEPITPIYTALLKARLGSLKPAPIILTSFKGFGTAAGSIPEQHQLDPGWEG